MDSVITFANIKENAGKQVKEQEKAFIVGRNPVIEALKSGREIEKLMIAEGGSGSVNKILGLAKERGIPVSYVQKQALDNVSSGVSHQGVAAFVSAGSYCEVEDILQRAKERNEDPFVLVLDGMEDPHNFGAIIRTAEAAGVHGIIIPKRRAVGITQAVAKASAGASEYMLCAKVSNLVRTLGQLKENGLWICGCDLGGKVYHQMDLKGALAVVIGGEGTGVSRLVKETCDFVCSIPMGGKINSLNASNAAAILMYEVIRQRDGQ